MQTKAEILDLQLRELLRMINRHEVFMLRKDYIHNLYFIEESFKHLREGVHLVMTTNKKEFPDG